MCRNIKTLFNFDPPATDDEIRAAALQFVRKLAGTRTPAKDNTDAFANAVDEIFVASRKLLAGMTPHGPTKNREEELLKARAKNAVRFRRADSGDTARTPLR